MAIAVYKFARYFSMTFCKCFIFLSCADKEENEEEEEEEETNNLENTAEQGDKGGGRPTG